MATTEKKNDKKGTSKPAKGGGAPQQQSKKSKADKGVEIKQGPHAGADLPIPAPRLKLYYESTVRDRLAKQFELQNKHEIPTSWVSGRTRSTISATVRPLIRMSAR